MSVGGSMVAYCSLYYEDSDKIKENTHQHELSMYIFLEEVLSNEGNYILLFTVIHHIIFSFGIPVDLSSDRDRKCRVT